MHIACILSGKWLLEWQALPLWQHIDAWKSTDVVKYTLAMYGFYWQSGTDWLTHRTIHRKSNKIVKSLTKVTKRPKDSFFVRTRSPESDIASCQRYWYQNIGVCCRGRVCDAGQHLSPSTPEFHETCASVTFYYMKRDSKWCCDTTTPKSIYTKDESKRSSVFAFIFGVNWPVQQM